MGDGTTTAAGVDRWSGGTDPWVLSFGGSDPGSEAHREALLTVGNGYMAVRGTMTHATADGVHYPAVYVAGVFNRLKSVVDGRSREDESIVNLPNWLSLSYRFAGGPWFTGGVGRLEGHRAGFDLRNGVVCREAQLVDSAGRRTGMSERRLVSMAEPHLGAVEIRLSPRNWSGRLEVRSVVDGHVVNGNVPAYQLLASRHLRVTELLHDGPIAGVVAETLQSRVRVAVVARTVARASSPSAAPVVVAVDEVVTAGHLLSFDVRPGDEIVIEKTAGVVTSRDPAVSEPAAAAIAIARDAPPFEAVLADHGRAWENLWKRFQVNLGAPDSAALAVRVHLVHLLQTLSPHTIDIDAGVPARGLHGEAYRGHVFWDELFVFPVLNLRLPELTRALLLYRWRRLPEARRQARAIGCRGALFPWQSGSDGREETPAELFNPRSGRWIADHSRRQYHINLAVAYNLWQHWQATKDLGFLVRSGAELLIETARFFASLATLDAASDRYDLRGVMGPDEFHDGYPDRPGEGVDNNAYLNIMASWALARAGDIYHLIGPDLGHELWDRLQVCDDEVRSWDRVSRRLRVPFLGNGLLAQFEGYDDLREFDWGRYRERYGDVSRLDLILEMEGDSTNCYKVSKQADVLMLFYLLSADELTAVLRRMGYGFDPASIPATVDYYQARTSHGSTLSRVVHAWVLARTDRRRSWDLLRQAFVADIVDGGGTTGRGIHLGAMAGTVDLLERCYTGLETYGDVLRFNPLLPDELDRLDLVLRYRDHILTVGVDHDRLVISSAAGPAVPITVALRQDHRWLAPGRSLAFRLPPVGGRPDPDPDP